MKAKTKQYLKLFLISGLSYGLLMSLWDFLDEGVVYIWSSLFQAAFFGSIMSWITIKAHVNTLRKFGKTELTEDDFKVSYYEFINKQKSIQDIYALLENEKQVNSWSFKIKHFKIVGKTNRSWSSWGEKIIITSIDDKIKIESKPLWKTVMFDNGINRGNVILLKHIIEK